MWPALRSWTVFKRTLPQSSRSSITYVVPVAVNCTYCTPPKHVEWSYNKIKILVFHLVGHFVCICIEKDARNLEPKILIFVLSYLLPELPHSSLPGDLAIPLNLYPVTHFRLNVCTLFSCITSLSLQLQHCSHFLVYLFHVLFSANKCLSTNVSQQIFPIFMRHI
jgi:hypothetical protein